MATLERERHADDLATPRARDCQEKRRLATVGVENKIQLRQLTCAGCAVRRQNILTEAERELCEISGARLESKKASCHKKDLLLRFLADGRKIYAVDGKLTQGG